MNNIQKLGRLVNYFASCDYDHNSNSIEILSADNGWQVSIEFDIFNASQLEVDTKFTLSNASFSVRWNANQLTCFTYNFEKLDELLGIIFECVIKTDMRTIICDSKINSELFFNPGKAK